MYPGDGFAFTSLPGPLHLAASTASPKIQEPTSRNRLQRSGIARSYGSDSSPDSVDERRGARDQGKVMKRHGVSDHRARRSVHLHGFLPPPSSVINFCRPIPPPPGP
ncbi:hypothetical protein FA13DRAFT_1727282 [Coprinellus micaceus]|uniref:Uncharacterized protein n=1 Tax=Coprinellus micaceus TaxID=71717 RepID=A0A4Y7TRU7_COPMI|nr:hypothetical protein FA13DRAFT_1737983 [Coprinellus micaceus]TEB36907.1 hypothetical protein FA13DRAFT_1727282 [Coprinellus micaceus]